VWGSSLNEVEVEVIKTIRPRRGAHSLDQVRAQPKFSKYLTMVNCRLPEGAIRQRMAMDDFSEADQAEFFGE
jgi:hypothetical protein